MRTTPLEIPVLPAEFVQELRAHIPQVARTTVATVAAEVPGYAPAREGPYRAELEEGVRLAFEGFAGLLTQQDPHAQERVERGARALGRTEARRRRGIGALLTAYQIGTRVHWQEVSELAIRQALDIRTMSELAALIFAYNQALSSASVEGYSAESRTRERNRELLAQALLTGTVGDSLIQQAGWSSPDTLTCVLTSTREAGRLVAAYPEALQTPTDQATAVLVPNASREALLAAVHAADAVIGPTVEWQQVAASYRRAAAVAARTTQRPADTEDFLVDLLLDGQEHDDLRTQMLAPLDGNQRLAETLRSWLLNSGRRDAVAAELHVHPQTVRYRMQQIRQVYGDRLHSPEVVLRLVVALGRSSPPRSEGRSVAPRGADAHGVPRMSPAIRST